MSSPWFPFDVTGHSGPRLLTLPHAGAGAVVFRAWARTMPSSVQVCPVQPPGREHRIAERPFTRVAPLVRDLAEVVRAQIPTPYAVLGHSTGALCAFELVRRLREIGAPLPVRLYVSGRPPPTHPMVRSHLAALTQPQLVALLRELGGTPEGILNEPAMLAQIHPILAADFEVNECYTFTPALPLQVPITAFTASADPLVEEHAFDGWADHTSAGFTLERCVGGHFAIFDQAAQVQARIVTDLAKLGREDHASTRKVE